MSGMWDGGDGGSAPGPPRSLRGVTVGGMGLDDMGGGDVVAAAGCCAACWGGDGRREGPGGVTARGTVPGSALEREVSWAPKGCYCTTGLGVQMGEKGGSL